MVKRKSKGSLLGHSSSGSKDKTGLYLVSIVAIVAIVALFLMVKGGAQTSSEEVMVVDEEGNVVGQAGWWADGFNKEETSIQEKDYENVKDKDYESDDFIAKKFSARGVTVSKKGKTVKEYTDGDDGGSCYTFCSEIYPDSVSLFKACFSECIGGEEDEEIDDDDDDDEEEKKEDSLW